MVDQRSEVTEFSGFGGQGGRAAGDGLHFRHAAHDVAEVRRRFTGQCVVAADIDEGYVRVVGGHDQRIFFELI